MSLLLKRNVGYRDNTRGSRIIRAFNINIPRKNDPLSPDDIFRRIFVIETFYILIKFNWNLFIRGSIDNNPALVQIMAWRLIGDKPLNTRRKEQFDFNNSLENMGEWGWARLFWNILITA